MPANYIDFVTSLIYGDLGASVIGPPPAGARNHLNWTLTWRPNSGGTTVTGNEFLVHHLDIMLARYEAWRSLHLLPPVRPWDGTNLFLEISPLVNAVMPGALSGAFPGGWTTNDLGTSVRGYYNATRNYVTVDGRTTEMDDETKAPFSYRYWAFMKWVSDLRKRLLGQPVFPVGIVYDRDGTILSEKEFADYINQVHHVWHPNSGPPSWTEPTPFFKTSVGQHRRKQQIDRAQIGAEFFEFHRDHLLLFDRWLARTSQDPVRSNNECAHDITGPAPSPPPGGVDVIGGGYGYPLVSFTSPPSIDFAPPHSNIWDGTRPGFDGTLREFRSLGEMGQFIATDFNPFPDLPNPPGAPLDDQGYHGVGHVLNGDLFAPFANNYSPRLFAWHGFLDDAWTKRQPLFTTFAPVQTDGSAYPGAQALTILRDFGTSSDAVEPANAIQSLNLTTGNGTLRARVNVRPDPFGRRLELQLRCEALREAGGSAPVIALPVRTLIATPGAAAAVNERQQGVDFIEEFVFDGSAGTVDGAGKGPFASANLNFPPTGPSNTSFLNSLLRVTGTLTCDRLPDGSLPSAAGTVTSAGTALTGSGTAFQTLFEGGDIIRAAGQTRRVSSVASNTSLTLSAPFSPDLPGGTPYARLDGFDHEQLIEIPLVQEQQAPDVTVYLDRSSFAKDQVDAIAAGGQSVFENAFYVMAQDRAARPAPIAWPASVEPALYGLIAPPTRAAGLYPDLAHAPAVELRDAATDTPLAGQVDVTVTAADPEDPSLHPSVPQRVTYRCRVTFTGNAAFAGMTAGDLKDMKLVVTVTDRSGNRAVNDTARPRLQVSANPYMLDGPTSWLSIDTRVFKIQQGQARFGVAAGWSDPYVFIQQVIANLRAGNGAAGGESFDGLPADQAGAVLEYSTQVGGVNIHNFALAKVRLQSVTGASNVRASFRLFSWGVANVAFDNTLAYRSDSASGVALLGKTTSNEVASIPFFSEPRAALTASMTTQTDAANLANFAPTGGGEALLFYGAYLDINQGTVRFPSTFQGDGGFGAVPPADMRSIRDLLVSQHQCMVVELFYPPDPTVIGATPGTSDNLSQRNLMILQTANPGRPEITRAVQHSFNIDLTRRRRVSRGGLEQPNVVLKKDEQEFDWAADDRFVPSPARPAPTLANGAVDGPSNRVRIEESWIGRSPELLKEIMTRARKQEQTSTRWQFDLDEWKPADGLDELVFFWNDLPREARVDVYLPGAAVEEILNYRNLRHAPGTVKIVDAHTLRLSVAGPTYLPAPPFWGDNLAGLITVTLPEGIRAGQRYVIDVAQLRSDTRRVLGGFQLNVQVDKAGALVAAEQRTLELFHRRLSVLPNDSRWRPILERQVAFTRERGRGLAELAGEPDVTWEDPTERQRGQCLRVVLDRIEVSKDHERRHKGRGEHRFLAAVASPDNGGQARESRVAGWGRRAGNGASPGQTLFEGYVEGSLALTIMSDERSNGALCPYKRVFNGRPGEWLGAYGPDDDKIDPEDLGDWKLWYHIERC